MTYKDLKGFLNLKIIGILILIWLLLRIDLAEVVRVLSISHLFFITLALILMIMHVLVKFARYNYILTLQGVDITFLKTMHYSLAAIYLSFVTPGRIGDVSKAFFVNKDKGTSLERLIAGSVVDRFFDIYTLLLTYMLGVSMLNSSWKQHFFMLLGVVAVLLPAFLFLSSTRNTIVRLAARCQIKLTGMDSWAEKLHSFFKEFKTFVNWRMIWGIGASLFAYALFFAACYLLCLAIDITLAYHKVAFFVACANILSFLPISFAGIGTREAILVYLFSTEGLSIESAMAFSLLIFSCTYIFFGIIGFISLMTLKLSPKEVVKNA